MAYRGVVSMVPVTIVCIAHRARIDAKVCSLVCAHERPLARMRAVLSNKHADACALHKAACFQAYREILSNARTDFGTLAEKKSKDG